MKSLYQLLFCFASVAYATQVGDAYEQVIREKGKPTSQMDAGANRILRYSDVSIKLKDNVVVSITPIETPAVSAPSASSVASTPTEAKLAAVRKAQKRAIARVEAIVNQPVTVLDRDPQMKVAVYEHGWFHDGAIKPDFTTVDVRATQTSSYSQFKYVTSTLNPGVVFLGSELEFNSMTKYFYIDRSLPKKKLSEQEMLEINDLYRIIGKCERELGELQKQ